MERINCVFLVKKDKKRRDDKCPLYLRIKGCGESRDLFLKINIKPDHWDSENQKVKSNDSNAGSINETIRGIENDICRISADLRLTCQTITPGIIKMRLMGNSSNSTLLELFAKHNSDIERRIGNDYSVATLKKYQLTKKKVGEFMNQFYKANDIPLQALKHSFILEFETFLKSRQNLNHNTAMKHIKNLKKIVRLGSKMDIILKNPFEGFRCSVKDVKRGFLTQEEIARLLRKETLNQRLEVVRDIFVFCCYTGLSYVDVTNLNLGHIQKMDEEFRTVIIPRSKTGVVSYIPLLPPAENIIEKYSWHSIADKSQRLFPVNSNQKMNEYLKEVATVCGISKILTFHMARHSFATSIALQNGLSMEVVQTILGHKNIRTTQIYAKMTDTRLSQEMKTLRTKLSINNKPHES